MVRLSFYKMVKMEKWMFFGSVRFSLFEKNLKTIRFLESYPKTGMSFVRYGSHFLTKTLYGSRLKTETENGVFFIWHDKRFPQKTEDSTVFG